MSFGDGFTDGEDAYLRKCDATVAAGFRVYQLMPQYVGANPTLLCSE
jgi:hypothetical protein